MGLEPRLSDDGAVAKMGHPEFKHRKTSGEGLHGVGAGEEQPLVALQAGQSFVE